MNAAPTRVRSLNSRLIRRFVQLDCYPHRGDPVAVEGYSGGATLPELAAILLDAGAWQRR